MRSSATASAIGLASDRPRSTAPGWRRSFARPRPRSTRCRVVCRACARGAGAGQRRAAGRRGRRRRAAARHPPGAAADIASAHVILAQALSRTGAHADALPALEAAHAERPDDESLLADLLRSEARPWTRGARSSGSSTTGRTCATGSAPTRASSCSGRISELLALDQPVRSGVRYDATHAGRPRARPRAAAGADGRLARGLDRRSGRAGEDAARPRPRARGRRSRSCTSSSWSASPRPRTSWARSARCSASATRSAAAGS